MTAAAILLVALAAAAAPPAGREPREVHRSKWRIVPPEGFAEVKKDRGWEWNREHDGIHEQIKARHDTALMPDSETYKPSCLEGELLGPVTEETHRGLRAFSYVCGKTRVGPARGVVEFKVLRLNQKWSRGENASIEVPYGVAPLDPEEWLKKPEAEKNRLRPSRRRFLDAFASLEPIGWNVPSAAVGEAAPGRLDEKKAPLLR